MSSKQTRGRLVMVHFMSQLAAPWCSDIRAIIIPDVSVKVFLGEMNP